MPGYTSRIAVKPRPAPVKDRYGKETFDWANAVPVEVDLPVSIQPVSQIELGGADHREQVTTAWRLISQPGQDLPLSQRDRVVWHGEDFDCTEVNRWPHPVIVDGVHHVEARIEKLTG